MQLQIKNTLEISEKTHTTKENEYLVKQNGVNIYEIGENINLTRGNVVIGQGKVKKIELTAEETMVLFEIIKLNGVD